MSGFARDLSTKRHIEYLTYLYSVKITSLAN